MPCNLLRKRQSRQFRKNSPGHSLGCVAANSAFNQVLLYETLPTDWVPGIEEGGQEQHVRAVMAALRSFKPRDEIEGMLAAQTVALHFGAMECLRRAMIPAQGGLRRIYEDLCGRGGLPI